MEGWIKLHRQIKDHWLWKSDNRFKWWIDILLTVNHSESKVLIKGTLIECKRGQSIRSLESWAKEWNVSKGAVRDFFKLLQSDEMLTTESLQFTTRITVCKYEDYQTELHAEETLKKRKGNAKETLALPKQECKEGIEGIEIVNTNTWRESFEIYLNECKESFVKFHSDELKLEKQERLNPNVDIKLTIEKAYDKFWGTEAGWKNKKDSKTKNIDWDSTIKNAISFKSNIVYKQK
ncbi:MAG TPA: hypothetical protein VIK55_06550 [Paludibacter sp.]